MGFINRFLLFLYALATAVVSLGVIAVFFGVLPDAELHDEIRRLLSMWETFAAALLFFIISVHLIGCSVKRSDKKEEKLPDAVLIHGESGDVRVSTEAVSNLAEKSAKAVFGVRDAKSVITPRAAGDHSAVHILLEVEMGSDQNAMKLSEAIRSAVSEQMANVLGLSDYSVDVSVSEISNEAAQKKQRVS